LDDNCEFAILFQRNPYFGSKASKRSLFVSAMSLELLELLLFGRSGGMTPRGLLLADEDDDIPMNNV
jgi:hypothetical protein